MNISRMPTFTSSYGRLQNTDTGRDEIKKMDKNSDAESSTATSSRICPRRTELF
ncbi:hypothetical protein ACWHAM_03380 [Paenibacillus terrae]